MASSEGLRSQLVVSDEEAATAVATGAPGGASAGPRNTSPGALDRALNAFAEALRAQADEDRRAALSPAPVIRARDDLGQALLDLMNTNPAMIGVPRDLAGAFFHAANHWLQLCKWSRTQAQRADALELALKARDTLVRARRAG